MTQVHHYSHPTTPAGAGSDTVISGAVQVRSEHRLTAAAAVGDAAVVGISVDDDAAAYDFQGLWRWYIIENACPSGDHYAWNGYVGTQTVSRGDGDTLIPVGTGRRWDLELTELSALAGFRVISGNDGNRSAETISDRLTWLIGTTYLPVNDNGLITYDTTALDANDYRGQRPADILNDMAVVVGFNWWIYYDQAAASGDEVSLAFFDPEGTLYSSSIKISNVSGDADGSTVFAPSEDARLERDPQKISAGVYLPYSGGAVYEYDLTTSYAYAFRDQVAPTASVKTSAKAVALADRFLADNATQDLRAHMTIQLPAAQLNDIKHGQRLQVKMQHWPGFSAYRWCRVVRKSFAPPENRSQNTYDVDLELSPQLAEPSGAFAVQTVGVSYSGQPALPTSTAEGDLLLLVVAGGGAQAQYPTDVRFKNNPSVSPATPEVPPFPDHDGWTVLGIATTDYSGQNIGGPCGVPYQPGGGVCTAGLITAIAWRRVQSGEESTVPVAVSTSVNNGSLSAWLWNLGNRPDPSGTVVTGDNNVSAPNASASLASISGNILSVFLFATSAGHGAVVQPTAASVGSGTLVQANDLASNQDLPTPANQGNWAIVGQMTSGGTPTADMSVVGAYASLNFCGVAVALPSGVVIPTIPYPANQT